MRRFLTGLVVTNIIYIVLALALIFAGALAQTLIARVIPSLAFQSEGGKRALPAGIIYFGFVADAIICGYLAANGNKDRPLIAGFLSSIIVVAALAYGMATGAANPGALPLFPFVVFCLPLLGALGAFLRQRLPPTALRGWVGVFGAAILVYSVIFILGLVLAAVLHSPSSIGIPLVFAPYCAIMVGANVMPLPRRQVALNTLIGFAILIAISDAIDSAISGQFKTIDILSIFGSVAGSALAYRKVRRQMQAMPPTTRET